MKKKKLWTDATANVRSKGYAQGPRYFPATNASQLCALPILDRLEREGVVWKSGSTPEAHFLKKGNKTGIIETGKPMNSGSDKMSHFLRNEAPSSLGAHSQANKRIPPAPLFLVGGVTMGKGVFTADVY